MNQTLFRGALLALLAIASNPAAAQSVQSMQTPRALPAQVRPDPNTIARVDPMRALADQVAELRKEVAALKQANEALAARVQSLDSGLGQVVTQNVSQNKQLGDLSSQLSGVSSKLANHRHAFKYKWIEFHTDSFVKESGGVASDDKMGNAAVITGTYNVDSQTEPAQ
jgi:hypothetical protein